MSATKPCPAPCAGQRCFGQRPSTLEASAQSGYTGPKTGEIESGIGRSGTARNVRGPSPGPGQTDCNKPPKLNTETAPWFAADLKVNVYHYGAAVAACEPSGDWERAFSLLRQMHKILGFKCRVASEWVVAAAPSTIRCS